MKICSIVLAVLLTVFSAHTAFGSETKKEIDQAAHVGKMIHEANVEGYQFAYHLVDLKKAPTWHLMVYILTPGREKIDQAKVGFLVKDPDGATQKLMAAGMKGAFGVNVEFKDKGPYIIKMKVVTGGKKLFDKFTYEVK